LCRFCAKPKSYEGIKTEARLARANQYNSKAQIFCATGSHYCFQPEKTFPNNNPFTQTVLRNEVLKKSIRRGIIASSLPVCSADGVDVIEGEG